VRPVPHQLAGGQGRNGVASATCPSRSAPGEVFRGEWACPVRVIPPWSAPFPSESSRTPCRYLRRRSIRDWRRRVSCGELRRRRWPGVHQHFGLRRHRRVIDKRSVRSGDPAQLPGTAPMACRRDDRNLVGLTGFEDGFPTRCSHGGMQRGSGLARALGRRPNHVSSRAVLPPWTRLIRRDNCRRGVLSARRGLQDDGSSSRTDLQEALAPRDRILLMGTSGRQIGQPTRWSAHPPTTLRPRVRPRVTTASHVLTLALAVPARRRRRRAGRGRRWGGRYRPEAARVCSSARRR